MREATATPPAQTASPFYTLFTLKTEPELKETASLLPGFFRKESTFYVISKEEKIALIQDSLSTAKKVLKDHKKDGKIGWHKTIKLTRFSQK